MRFIVGKEKSKFSVTHKDESMVELVRKTDHKTLAVWAVDCFERVMSYFEEKYPEDHRPRNAIEAFQAWINTGCLRWLTYAGLRLHLMLLLVKWEKIILLVLPPVPQVKPWRLRMSPPLLLVPQITPYRLSIEPPTPLMPMPP